MLVIHPTEDGRLRVQNSQRSDVVPSEAAARSTAHRWGHTDVTINKALAEMRGRQSDGPDARAWRILRPESGSAEARSAAPSRRSARGSRSEAPKETPAAERVAEAAATEAAPRKRTRKRAAAGQETAQSVAQEPEQVPAATAFPAVGAPEASPQQPKRGRARKRPAPPEAVAEAAPDPVKASAPEAMPEATPARRSRAARAPQPAQPAAAPREGAPRERALELMRQGVRELTAIEKETLPFARAPWSELREMAEYIAACLEGKKPTSSWRRDLG